MTLSHGVAIALVSLSLIASSLRWLRVSQREHYLAGSTARFAARWWTKDSIELAALGIGIGCVIISARFALVAIGVFVVLVAGPFGLGLRGRTSRLRWTRRLTTVASLVFGLDALAVVLCIVLSNDGVLVVVIGALALFCPLVIDLALGIDFPLEEVLARRFVSRAITRLGLVAPTVVGVTGSYGKTSTKGYIAHLAQASRSVLTSPRSFNNRAGLARTVNELLSPGTEVLVAEMGTYGPGEIAKLCAWLKPEIAVITAIGPVHLERFKTLERTLTAKAEITAGARTVVLNVDDERLAGLAERLAEKTRVLTCGARAREVDVGVLIEAGNAAVYLGGSMVGQVPVAPEVVATNLACAIAVALELGCSAEQVLQRIPTLPAAEHRLNVDASQAGVVVLDDTFNSNPAGAKLALRTLELASPDSARRVVVTPGMVELGSRQDEENAAFAADAARFVTDFVIVNETNRKALVAGLHTGHGPSTPNVVFARSRVHATTWVREHLGDGDVVLYENDLPDHYP